MNEQFLGYMRVHPSAGPFRSMEECEADRALARQAIDMKAAAIRLLIRKGIRPSDVRARDAENAERISKRGSRGNVSLQQGNVETQEELDAARDAYRRRAGGRQAEVHGLLGLLVPTDVMEAWLYAD